MKRKFKGWYIINSKKTYGHTTMRRIPRARYLNFARRDGRNWTDRGQWHHHWDRRIRVQKQRARWSERAETSAWSNGSAIVCCQKRQMTADWENLPSGSDFVNQRVRDTTLGIIIDSTPSSVIGSPITIQRVWTMRWTNRKSPADLHPDDRRRTDRFLARDCLRHFYLSILRLDIRCLPTSNRQRLFWLVDGKKPTHIHRYENK